MGEAYPNGGFTMFDNWYAVQVRSGKEEEIMKKCALYVDGKALKECFVPKSQKMKKFKGKWETVYEVLFKGYVFMISDDVAMLYNELKKVPDLTKLIGNDGKEIYPILQEEAKFLTRFGGKDHVVEVSTGYVEGDEIKITHGPLVGQEGSITKIDRHKRIATVDVSLLGRITRVQVGLEVIMKI